MKNEPRAFTIVELLVVIAVISVLAAMLLPTLDASLLQARILACAGNHRQTGNGFLMFETDLRRFPRVLNSYGRDQWPGIWIDATTYISEPLAGYFPDASVYAWISPSGTGTERKCTCASDTSAHRLCDRPRTLSMIRDDWQSRYPLLSCREGIYTAAGGIDKWLGEHLSGNGVYGSNLFFLDGHVEWRAAVGAWSNSGSTMWCFYDHGNHGDRKGLWMYPNTGAGVFRVMPDEMFGINPTPTLIYPSTTGTVTGGSSYRPPWYRQ